MAVDKQKILNELGNIVNQLQSADCGCLGKVFSNPGQGNPPNYQGSCFQGGDVYQGGFQGGFPGGCQNNTPCAGEPCPGARRCMGFSNPAKLFADTYSYLKPNLMQPVVQEVYDELKSINPQNTIMNNGRGAQMGLPGGATNVGQGNAMAPNPMQEGGMGNANTPHHMHGHPHHHMPHLHFGNVDMNSMNQNNQQGMEQMGQMNPGMGQMNPGMGQITPGVGQGFGQMGQGINQMGQDMGQAGHEMGHMGHGMGHMGHNIGHGMGQGMGQEMGQPTQAMGQMEQGMGQPVYGMGQPGQGMDQPGQGMGQPGQGMGQPGQGMGQMEQGMSQGMGPGIVQDMGYGHQTHPSGGIAGMGPQIVNMMQSSMKQNYKQNQGGAPPNAPIMPQSREISQIPGDVNQGQYYAAEMQNAGYMGGNNMTQGDAGMQGGNQFMTQPNMNQGAVANARGNEMPNDMQQMNPQSQRMGHMNDYGVHNAGMSKFNEMFSGMMKGDLGFDPMAIAIQMNPANEKRSAIDKMQKMMTGDRRHNPRLGQSSDSPQANLTTGLREMIAANAQQQQQQQQPEEAAGGTPMQNNQQIYNAQAGAPIMNQQMPPQQEQQIQEQQIQQQQIQQQQWQQQPQEPYDKTQQGAYQQQQQVDQNAEAVVSRALPTVYEGYPNVRTDQNDINNPPHLYKEPIFPADISRHLLQSHHFAKPQKFFEYNTLGQPVEVIPVRQYRAQLHEIPQRMPPEPYPSRFSNVKSTVSKTALMGNKPEGKTPSRTQLQRVYNQYKGSQSFTQQNIKPTYTGSYSAGHINVGRNQHHPHPPQPVHIEKVGGDTVANNQIPTKLEGIDQDPVAAKKAQFLPVGKNIQLRNGLQDQVYSSPPSAAKWTFHGTGTAPFSTGYRFKIH